MGVRLLLALFVITTLTSIGSAIHPAPASAASTYSGTWASGPSKDCPVAGGNTVKVPAVMAIAGLAGSWACARLSGNQHQMILTSSQPVSSCNPSDKGILTVGSDTSTNPNDWYDQVKKATLDIFQGAKVQCNSVHLVDGVALTNNFAAVATTSSSSSGSSTSSSSCSDPCPVPCGSQMRWLTCFLVIQITAGLTAINTLIGALLDTPVNIIFSPQSQNAFNTFRNLGIGLLVITGLVMVIAQASGSDLFAAYTVRKALPRIVIAAIGIALAWPLLQFVITLFNDLGNLVGKAILQVGVSHNGFDNVGNAVGYFGAQLLAQFLTGAVLLGIVLSLTVGGFLSLILSAILMLLMGIIVLALRQIIILICILLAPLAIAAYVLPGTERFWKFWQNTLLTTLVMYPIIMAFLAAGEALSSITASAATNNPLFNVIAIGFYVGPYAALPFASKMAGGLMSQVVSLAQGFHGQNIEGRLRQYRHNERQWLHQQRMEGRDNGLGFERFGIGNMYRRFGNRGGIHVPGGGREERFQQAERKRMGLIAAKTAQEDQNYAGGDDLATNLASQNGMTRNEFIRRYMAEGISAPGAAKGTATHQQAEAALAAIQSSFNSDIGTTNMMTAAWKARANSVTGYEGSDNGLEELRDDARRMIDQGLVTEADAILTIKANKARMDQAGIGWGNWQRMIRDGIGAGTNPANGNDQISMDTIRFETIRDNGPGALIGARPEAVDALAKHMAQSLQTQANIYAAGGNATQTAAQAERELMQQLASTAGLYDVMSQIAPSNARRMADNVMQEQVNFRGGMSVQDAIELVRSDPQFLQMRREYSANYNRQAVANQNAAAQQAAQGNPPGIPPIPGAIP